ncbi:MAG: hypothetical protein HY425_01995 [Candidatus Levybacteria bacterium]|nr:hypothetical protein [Candidatus Levybacteria bacterium]
MAGTPEKSAASNLDHEQAKRKIGEFYLRGVLSNDERTRGDSQNLEFRHAMQKMSEKARVGLPSSFIEDLGLKQLVWKKVSGYYHLPLILTGFPDGKETSINNALATIEVAQRITSSVRQQTEPLFLRIAGVHQDDSITGNKRIVAATYDLIENGRLTSLDVSVCKDEYPQESIEEIAGNGNHSPRRYRLQNIMVALPSDREKPYKTAALVTPGMVNAIRTDEPPLYALSIKLDPADSSFFGPPHYNNPGFVKIITDRLGYYAERKDGLTKAGLTEEGAEKRGLTPWQISIPASLPKILN